MNFRKTLFMNLVIISTINTSDSTYDVFFNAHVKYQYVCFEFSDQKDFNAFKKIMDQLPGKKRYIFEKSSSDETDVITFQFDNPIKKEDLEHLLKQYDISCGFREMGQASAQ